MTLSSRIWRGAIALLLIPSTSGFAEDHDDGRRGLCVGPMAGPLMFPWGLGGMPGWGVGPAFFLGGPVTPMYVSPMGMSFYNGMPVAPQPLPMPARAPRPSAVLRSSLRPVDPAKSAQLATIGDRLFRARNIKRAAERYEQAIRLDPDSAPPRVHLAQVSLTRGQISEAAAQIRAAVNADPSWIFNAPDIQALYAEPEDFAKQLAKLESRVLVEPGDRDAWLVLGAELFLSGRTRRAQDIFTRLSDRKPDPALATFLDAAHPRDDPAR